MSTWSSRRVTKNTIIKSASVTDYNIYFGSSSPTPYKKPSCEVNLLICVRGYLYLSMVGPIWGYFDYFLDSRNYIILILYRTARNGTVHMGAVFQKLERISPKSSKDFKWPYLVIPQKFFVFCSFLDGLKRARTASIWWKMTKYEQKCNLFKFSMSPKYRNPHFSAKKALAACTTDRK